MILACGPHVFTEDVFTARGKAVPPGEDLPPDGEVVELVCEVQRLSPLGRRRRLC
jgi:hypothetical protein